MRSSRTAAPACGAVRWHKNPIIALRCPCCGVLLRRGVRRDFCVRRIPAEYDQNCSKSTGKCINDKDELDEILLTHD